VCVCVKGCNVACVCEPSPIVPWRAHDVRAHASSEISLPTHPVVIVSPGAPDPCYARCICTCIAWSSPVRSGKIAIPGPVCAPVGSDRVVPWPEIATPPTAGVRVTGCAARRGAHRPPPPLNRLPAGPASEPSSHGGGTSPGGRSHGFCSICASATSGAALFFFVSGFGRSRTCASASGSSSTQCRGGVYCTTHDLGRVPRKIAQIHCGRMVQLRPIRRQAQ
jgi:hypothetical protein